MAVLRAGMSRVQRGGGAEFLRWRRRAGDGAGAAREAGQQFDLERMKTIETLTCGAREKNKSKRACGPANPRHRKDRWFRELSIGVIVGVKLTRFERF